MTNITDKRLKALAARTDAQIDYSEIPELDEAFWKDARMIEPAASAAPLTRFAAETLENANGAGVTAMLSTLNPDARRGCGGMAISTRLND